MGWLSTNWVTLDYFKRKITFNLEGEPTFHFMGEHDCLSLFLSERRTRNASLSILFARLQIEDTSIIADQDQPVIKEILDIFREELSPHREIEFCIDSILGIPSLFHHIG